MLELNKTADSRSLIRIEGVTSVALMSHVPQLDRIVLVVGKQRDLMCFCVSEFEARRHENPPTVTLAPVADVSARFDCTELHIERIAAQQIATLCIVSDSQSDHLRLVALQGQCAPWRGTSRRTLCVHRQV